MKGKITIWQTPKCYFGFDPVGHILVASMHRESSILDQSNYWTAWHRLTNALGVETIPRLADIAQDGPFSRFDPNETPLVYEWDASSSLVGWIRYLMLRPCCESRALIESVVCPMEAAIDAYPILDESDYYERQVEAMGNYWKTESLKQRIAWCKEAGESIFAARRSCVPERVEMNWSQEMFA